MTWEEEAKRAADALGKTFVVGVRSHGRGWFANCDGVEYDGSSPETAVAAVFEALWRRAEAFVETHETELLRARRTLDELTGPQEEEGRA